MESVDTLKMHWLVAKFLAERRSNRNLTFLARTSVGDMLAYKLAKITKGFIVDSMTFKYRRKITITEQSGNNLSDYQVRIDLDATNFDFSHLLNEGKDLRFTDANGNLLPYWVEKMDITAQEATIWVKVPSIPANSSVDIYMYYGCPTAESASNGEATFAFFDDFNIYKAAALNCAREGVFGPHGFPQAIYHNDKVILAYQGPNQDIYVLSCSRDGTIDGPYFVVDNPLTNDSHGVPVIWVDADGYYHIAYGAHDYNPLKHVRSANPDDISSWVSLDNITDYATYPQVIELDGTLYLFYRAGGHRDDWVYRTSTDGGYTWSGETVVIDSTLENVWYVSFRKGKDGRIHVAWVWKDEQNSLGTDEPEWYQRYNVYYMYRDHDGSWKNIEGETLTLPITKDIADTYCLVYRTDNMSPLKHCGVGGVDATPSGVPFIVFTFGDLYGGWNYEIKCARWNGSSWDIISITPTPSYASAAEINVIDNETIEIFAPGGGVFCGQRNDLVRGGQIEKWVSHDGGLTFSLEKVIAKSPDYRLIMVSDHADYLTLSKSNIFYNPQMIKDGNEEFKIIFGAWTPFFDEADRGIFIWGEDGFKGSNSQDGYVRAYISDPDFRGALYATDYAINDDVIIEMEGEMDSGLIYGLVANMQDNGEAYDGSIARVYNSAGLGRIDFDANYADSALEGLNSVSFTPETNHKYLLQLVKKVDGYLELRVNGVSVSATNTLYSGGYPGISFHAGGSSETPGSIKFWWFRVRKYTEPEPSVSIGEEESA